MKPDYDTTLARIVGNVAGSMIPCAIIDEIKRTEPKS